MLARVEEPRTPPEPGPPRGAALDASPADPLDELARDAQEGSRAAMRRLLEVIGPKVLRVVRSVCRTGGEVEDVAQESMIAFVKALPAFRLECSVVHYAQRIAARTAIAARRRDRAGREQLDSQPDTDRVADEPGPADEAVAATRRLLLRDLLDELPSEQAETLLLRVVLGHSLEEVASATGAPVNTVRSRVRLAKERLRRRIEDDPRALELLVAPSTGEGSA